MDIRENSRTDDRKAVNTDYYPLASSAIRRVRFVNNIISKANLYPGEENKGRS